MNRIAKKIQDARKKAGLSEKELAKKCGLSVGYIIQIESGKKIINEKVADKILNSLGESAVIMAPVREEVKEEPKKVKKQAPKHTTIVEPTGQWADALAGVIKKYPIYSGQMKDAVAQRDLPILDKKIEGHHPDKIIFMETPSDDLKSKRIHKGDILTLVKTKDLSNNKIYIYKLMNSVHIGVLRKESNRKIAILSDKTGREPIVVDEKRVEIVGRVIKVEFTL